MEAELGHFADFHGSRDQLAVLVDVRPDDKGRRGLIVEHPYFHKQLQSDRPLDVFYVSESTLQQLDRIQNREHRAANHERKDQDRVTTVLSSYRDPVAGGTEAAGENDDLIAVVEPILLRRQANRVLDSGWLLLVQESKSETLAPISRLRSMVIYGGSAALVLVVLIMACLWWLVVLVQNAPSRLRASQLWSGRLTGASTTESGTLSNRLTRETATETDEDVQQQETFQ
jgi:hypothetical protein